LIRGIAPAPDAAHYIQIGSEPLFRGTGEGELLCSCGKSVLVEGYLPANFLAIRLQCFRCGAVTTTPGLAQGEILPRWATPVEATAMPKLTASPVARGELLVAREAIERQYAATRPESPPDESVLLSRSLLEAAAANYDRLTGGLLGQHTEASPLGEGEDHGPFPFAWATLRLRERIDQPGWAWLYQNDDAMAAMYVVAMHHLMRCWARHPLLARLAAPLAQRNGFIRAVTTLAMAKLLFDAGNRVGFTFRAGDVDVHFSTPAGEPLSLALLAPKPLQWRHKDARSTATLTHAVIDALRAAQARVNTGNPGIVVLATSILQPDFDQMAVDAIHAAFHVTGRRHRGVAAVAIIMPKVLPAGPPDRVGFGYAFYPILNPRFAGKNPVRFGPR
jgi:hypothetical protein